MLLQKDEAQQEGSRIWNVYHVIRQREVRLSKDANPILFAIAGKSSSRPEGLMHSALQN